MPMVRPVVTNSFSFLFGLLLCSLFTSSAMAFQCTWNFEPQAQYDTGENATGVDAADFNGDGYPDLVVANRNTNDVVVLTNDGLGNFTLHSTVFVGGTPRYVVAGDLDGDGDIDAVTPNWDSETVSILLNDGLGNLSVLAEYPFRRPSCID
ncbi:MAG TPA: VCBS repeat-containing protein, partial [Phycisphaerales bacterium]|nr:VCBS repeat-containing protein [Phycisphaerales bacterium]